MRKGSENVLFGTILGAMMGLLVLLIAVGLVIRGWVLEKLWGWFIVPATGLEDISVTVAIGISLFVGLLIYNPLAAEKKEDREKTVAAVLALGGPFITLFIGWVVHNFFM